ncbi:MAG: hypothetical protein FWE40_01330 [Oscillospiraceae bacterium]|nr:hypothetical protein [Oscillospiraceae bacterium]
MVGLGKWKFFVDTMFYRGDAVLMVGEKNGKYDIDISLTGVEIPDFSINDMKAEGNTVTGNVQTSMMKGKDIPFSCTFEGDTANGMLKVPFMGKIALKDGKKIG